MNDWQIVVNFFLNLDLIIITVCFRCIKDIEGFKFTPRTREDLPSGFPPEIEEVCYFLDGYEHPNFAGCDDTEFDHIDIALQELNQRKWRSKKRRFWVEICRPIFVFCIYWHTVVFTFLWYLSWLDDWLIYLTVTNLFVDF